ncbi:MAG: TonB-dependent receptor [Saprospiraceae bacterium]|nr:TonB-dependent receptor [Saprospiraceae bacterium]
MKEFLIGIMVVFGVFIAQGQYTISGSVKNGNNESLSQATVFLEETYFAAITDDAGGFIIENVPEGTYRLKSSYVGYTSFTEVINLTSDLKMDINLGESLLNLDGVEINATRVQDEGVFTYLNLDREDLEKENLGQDVPFLLRWTPSAVVTSDAGAGIGYTGIRIRGSDPTSINVTINGVPLNDSESHNVFWVDLPDFMTSVDNLQIQRGVGTSTNGAAAFGGTISMNTNKLYQNPYAHVNTSYGSFNSRKLSVNLGTGLLNDKYSIDGRYSTVKSDGYIDRASSDLKSWYFSAARLGEKSSLRLIAFSGKERTYQSWWGAPESLVEGDETELQNHYDRNSWSYTQADSINLFNSDRRYNYYLYENQVDDYQQDHYQLHYSLSPVSKFQIKTSVHYTRGFGFFEEFKSDESYANYDLPEVLDASGDLIDNGDLVRRRWLDNHFYGAILNTAYQPSSNLDIQIGGAWSQYKGDHYGNVVTAENIPDVNLANLYYEGVGDKTDFNAYAKANYRVGNFNLFGDVQIREIDYIISGTDNDLTQLDLDLSYSFFNPKIGMTYLINEKQNVYGSLAVANKEPIRGDLIDNLDALPTPETLYNIEAGYRLQKDRFNLEWNNYVMLYDNQLVLTGDVNDSGAFLKQNVGKSSRIGTELSLSAELTKKLFWNINATLSRNKVDAFLEDFGDVVNEYENTDISFSPSVIAANAFMYRLREGIEFELSTKYVGKQFLDNTSNEDRSLPAYSYTNLRVSYDWDPSFLGNIKFNGMIYNLLDAKYSSNGYTYSYSTGESIVTENFVYPQAGIHFMVGMNIEF